MSDDLDKLAEEAAKLVDQETGDGLALVKQDSAPAVRKRMKVTRTRAAKLSQQVEKAMDRHKAELDRRVAEMEKRMNAEMAKAEETLGPLREMVQRLEEGIWTVNLYLGREEQIVKLADGEPADPSEPIQVRQMVLAMDQECAAAAEEGGIDAIEIDAFDQWLTEDPVHLEQVLPEAKGVVALRPRFDFKMYEDPWKTQAVAEANEQTYFLIRNGDRLFRTWTDFNVGKNLIPTDDEFTSLFRKRRFMGDGEEPLEPGGYEWQKAEKKAEARERHYMRVALILQGLIDRTTLFHPLPEGGASFMDPRHHEEGKVRFIADAEPSLGDGHEPFPDWQKRLMGELRAGMRVVGAFDGEDFRSKRWEIRRTGQYHHPNVNPPGAAYPKQGVIYKLEGKDRDGDLVFRYERDDEVYDSRMWVESKTRPGWGHYGGYRKPKTKASCKVKRTDPWIIPFDFCKEEELRRFLRARTDRQHYVRMFPLIKSALRARIEEDAAEAPFRKLLAGELMKQNGATAEEAEAAVPGLVDWFKFANRHHRPLVGEDEQKAVLAIVKEDARRRAAAKPKDPGLISRLRKEHPKAMMIARRTDGAHVVLEPMNEGNVFYRLVERGKTGKARNVAEWLVAGPHIASWSVYWTTERWEKWNRVAVKADHLTDPELKQMLREVRRAHVKWAKDRSRRDQVDRARGLIVGVTYDEKNKRFEVFDYARPARIPRTKVLTGDWDEPDVIAFAYRWHRVDGRLELKSTGGWGKEYSWGYGGTDAPWRSQEQDLLIYTDEALLARVRRDRARYEAAREKASEVRDEAQGFQTSIEEQWRDREWGRLYAEFLEEYEDPELWEGHKKTLDEPNAYHADFYRAIDELTERLVEKGTDLDGVTVKDAAALLGDAEITEKVKDVASMRFERPPPEVEDDEDDEKEWDDVE